MKVVITGATGLIGCALTASLLRDGNQVSVLVRDVAAAARRLPGATLHPWDATGGPPPEAAFQDVDGIVNLVGESIAGGRWTDARRKRLRDSRIISTRALVDAIQGLGRRPAVLVSASGAGYYGDRGDEILTEASAPGHGFLPDLARDWEAEAQRAHDLGVRVTIVRNGSVLSRDGGFLRKVLTPFRLGLGGRLGDGRQWFPWIHIDDEIGLVRHALQQAQAAGTLNAVAPEPITNRELTAALGEALSRPTVLAAPKFAVRMALGAMADELLFASQRVMPVRTLESGYKFKHPLLRPALKDLLAKKRG
jgi:uncharacterized protein (TIGR01777 family)